MESRQTIYALATPPGKSGVAVVRISGAGLNAVCDALAFKLPAPRIATLATLRMNGKWLDQALLLYFPAPNSFTGEDVLELQLHGSRAVISTLFGVLSTLPGLRYAEPGEFTRRAVLNGKLDLLQAEALADLIDAETEAQSAQALAGLDGAHSAALEDLRLQTVQALALLEAYIDFPDEEIPDHVLQDVDTRIEALKSRVAALLADNHIGERIREGFTVVIVGKPNAGKSSLLNALTKREVAIVSETPGTTRDMIEAHLNIGGLPVVLVDTAGLRETADAIEQEGVARALARAEKADLVVQLLEPGDTAPTAERTLLVQSKADLGATAKGAALCISAKTGEGLDALVEAIAKSISQQAQAPTSPIITRARHREALIEAQSHLGRFCMGLPLELSCEELRRAANGIGKITGKILVDELLDHVFKQFCIGK